MKPGDPGYQEHARVEAGVTVFLKEKSIWQTRDELPDVGPNGVVIDTDMQLCLIGNSTALRTLARALDREARALEYRDAQLEKGRYK